MNYEYTHLISGEEIGPADRTYRATEIVVEYHGRQVLALNVTASGASFCDGSYASHLGGINVKGYVVKWKYKSNERGEPVSQIEPIQNETERREVAHVLESEGDTSPISFL